MYSFVCILGRGFHDFLSITEAFLCDLVNTFAVGKVRGIDKTCNSSSSLSLAKVEPEGGCVCEDVTANWLGWIAPHCVWLRVDLIGHEDKCVVDVRQLLQILEVPVELLLAVGEHTSANIFGTEVAGEGINDDHLDVQALAHALDFINEEHLMSGIVGSRHVDT